jgi:general transcription factor 3C polypeptide 3 (transcription factor C subunit 4)
MELEKEKEVIKGYRRLKELWAGMLNEEVEAEREWLVQAEKLVDMFRETRNLFLTSRVCDFRSLIIISDFVFRTTPFAGCSREVGKGSRPTRLKRTRRTWLLGSNLTWVCMLDRTSTELIIITCYVLERDSLARKSARSGEKPGAVNVFRGINFDDWLRLFMQVRPPFLSRELALNVSYPVLLHLDETGSVRCRRRNPSACHGIQRVSAQRTAGFHPASYR